MKSANLQLETLVCPSCTQKIEGLINSYSAVDKDSVKLSFTSSKLKFNFDDSNLNIEEVVEAIGKLGFDVLKFRVK